MHVSEAEEVHTGFWWEDLGGEGPLVKSRRRWKDDVIMIYDIFVNCNLVATLWQQYSTHLHTNNTQNDTKIVERCGPCPVFADVNGC